MAAMPDEQLDDRANSILDVILEPGDGDPDATVDNPNPAGDATETVDKTPTRVKSDEQVADEVAAESDDTASEAEAPPAPIEPPNSWKADAKDRFKALPPELQAYVLERESERERGLSKTQQDSAEARKAADAERDAAKAERQAYADRLGAIIEGVANSNPKLQEWQQRDWEKYARDNPLEYGAEWFAYQKAAGALQAARSERDRVQQQTVNEQRLKAHDELTAKLDFWKDTDKRSAFQSELRTWGKAEGWSDAEINGIEDSRALLMARKAMLYDKLMAEQSKIAATKKPLPTGKVLKTQATESTGAPSQHADRLAKVAARTGRTDDQAAAILARL